MTNEWTAVVCGGTAGIGLACAEALLAAGAVSVVINGRDIERAERARIQLLERYPHAKVHSVIGDASRPDMAARVMQTAADAMGRIDVLVNSTGGNDLPRLLNEVTTQEIPAILERCLFAQILCSHAALPFMREQGGGAIINIASDAAKIPTPGESVIGAAMAGIVMFTRGLAIEEKRHGIRANIVTPSITTGTDHYERVMADPFAGRMFAKAHDRAKLGVVAKEELADLVAFLASPAAKKITGQAISITGGISAL
ncbi:SDR family NAD(P)-dependent oxidoreductase [Pollutimonas thiosulfatoxidans]|uniref:Short-chain dehydrogenase n=1 Tax=Pollutimonas thiosulfatoxidans TaxID=2028345 RepID=A0A410GE82_9BURK|nr:SDR family oxidoreductase [Pollutimonas thiosulfatoxidans]QAA94616.1 short-chain dehydrogenase [Pollutimonas thiosulfatoxidans]